VKIGVFSDVHGDLVSLLRVLRALERLGAEKLVCLGDLVVHGQRPNEVVELIRTLDVATVGGNHDHGAIHYGTDPKIVFFNPKSELHTALTQPLLSDENRGYLEELPECIQPCAAVSCVHAGYRDRYALLYNQINVVRMFEDAPTPLTLCGHTHRTRIYRRRPDGTTDEIDPFASGNREWCGEIDWFEDQYILNCGNTSQLLYDRLPSVCGLLDASARVMTWKQVS